MRCDFILCVKVVTLALLIVFSIPLTLRAVCQESETEARVKQGVNEGILPTGRLINPVGKSIAFHGRPVDLAIGNHGQNLLVKDRGALRIIDVESFEEVQSIPSPGGASLYGLAVASNGNVYFTNSKQGLHVYSPVQPAGDEANNDAGDKGAENKDAFKLARTIQLPTDSFPCGVALADDEKSIFVCLSKKNSVVRIDLESGKVQYEVPVGVAPFDVIVDGETNQLFVSNIGGRRAKADDKTAPSAKTETVVDKRGIASTGTVSIVDLNTQKVVEEISVGRHPSVMLATKPSSAFVCNTNEDSISWITKGAQAKSWTIKPEKELPFGSMPSALAGSADSKYLFVALAGNNAIAVVDAASEEKSVLGLIPTGWYPASLAIDDKYLFVGNIKGVGARAKRRDMKKGMNSHDHQGTVQRVELSDIYDQEKLAAWTKQVLSDSRVPQILRANIAPVDEAVPAIPVPKKLGHPSLFKHVIYVIKENRTFDQVFGDLKQARSEPALCVFPREVTPNHHALAERFGILDNYYCNGVLSADGHSWATEGNVTPYLERAFGGFARSYTFGDDPITYSSSGFIWDHVLDAGLSFRSYGEMDYAEPPKGMKYQDIYKAFTEGKALEFKQVIGIERLKGYSCQDYPGWNMQIPDVLRMSRFLKEFREFEKNDGLPALTILYLPQDHLGGGVTSRAHMADNDLALGQLVEAVSHSKFWKDTMIVVNEDDPQNGYDHIDGHRSLCLVISPYSKAGVNHGFYNQTSVLRTILHIFGLPPMNQQDASTPLMSDCFQGEANLEPYNAIAANFPLNESPKPKDKQSGLEKKWRSILATVPIERTGMKTETDEDNLNRFIWHEVNGWESKYPEEWAGAHGRGLNRLGLVFDPAGGDD